jgi:hypothetical protein
MEAVMTRLVGGNKGHEMVRKGPAAANKPRFDATRTLAMVKDGDVLGPLLDDEHTTLRPLHSVGLNRTLLRPQPAAPTTLPMRPLRPTPVAVAAPAPLVIQPAVAPPPARLPAPPAQPLRRSRGLATGIGVIGTMTVVVVGLLFAGDKLAHGRVHEGSAATPPVVVTHAPAATPTVLVLEEAPVPQTTTPATPSPVAPTKAQPIAGRAPAHVAKPPAAPTPVATTPAAPPAQTVAQSVPAAPAPSPSFTPPPTASDPDPNIDNRDAKKLTEEADKELLNLLPPK